MVRVTLTGISLALALASALAAAQAREVDPLALPLDVRGLVHRTVEFGCGQAWDVHEASSRTALVVSRAGRARLTVETHIVDESGGVAGLLGGGPYHSMEQHDHRVVWTGRATPRAGQLLVSLRGLEETNHVLDMDVTSRSRVAATLLCTREEHEVFASSRPRVLGGEAPTARRPLVSCSFEPLPNEGPVPHPVEDRLTTPFLLEGGPGITTDASYDGAFQVPAPYLVAREPGGFALP